MSRSTSFIMILVLLFANNCSQKDPDTIDVEDAPAYEIQPTGAKRIKRKNRGIFHRCVHLDPGRRSCLPESSRLRWRTYSSIFTSAFRHL